VTRPRLLFLGHTLPYPPDRGVALRSYHVLRELADRYEVTALLFRRRYEPTQMPLNDRIRHLREVAEVEVFDVPGERSAIRRRLDRTRSLVGRRSEARWRFMHRPFRRRVLELAFQKGPRLIHVDGIVLHGILPVLSGHRVVLAHHRSESRHLRLRAELSDGLDRWYLERQAEWMVREEREWLPRVSANTVTWEEDRDALRVEAEDARIEMVPPAVDTHHYTPAGGTGHGLAFVGGARAPASRDALEYFAEAILPRLRRASGVQTLEPISWVGTALEGDRERYRERGIDITGYVEDIRPIVRPAACYVVPRRAAGGRTRILQAWAMGKAVVSTSVGCRGLDARDGENILVRDDPDSFARAVLDVLEDGKLRRRLGVAARRTVEEQYSWQRGGTRLLELYSKLESAPPLRVKGAPPAPGSEESTLPT
jgi:glycosyltransferase involved in cell wall biosynthesis